MSKRYAFLSVLTHGDFYTAMKHMLLGLGMSRYRIRIMSDMTPTHMITLNYTIFSNYYRCQHVCVMSGVRV
jgi:hypothetical protein